MIEVEGLSFRYPGADKECIQDVSFSIAKGSTFGLLGPSGSGKSTMQKLIIGLLDNYKGVIRVMDKSLKDWGNEYYNKLGVSFELPNHYENLTARENLKFFASLFPNASVDFAKWLERLDLSQSENTLVKKMSKGMKMRLNFIRAIQHDPDIIFLDEPTSGLDPVTAELVKSIIKELRDQGKTILLTTHNMYDAQELCNTIAFLVDGKLAEIDSPEALRSRQFQNKVVVAYKISEEELAEKIFSISGLGTNEEFISLLRDQDGKITSINSNQATLEDVFKELVVKGNK